MSGNIDYNELDKAVGEAMRAHSVAASHARSSRPGATPARSATRPSITTRRLSTPTRRPSQGQFIDFAPRSTSTMTGSNRPTSSNNPTSSPRATTTRPALATRLAQAQAQARVRTQTGVQTRTQVKTQAQIRPQTPKRPIVGAETRPRPRPTRSSIAKPQISAKPLPKTKPQPAPVSATATKTPQPTTTAQSSRPPTKTPRPTEPKAVPESPNANNYSLGVRSPFMVAGTKVTKRPLGQNIPETSASNIRSTKNIYSQKSPTKSRKQQKKHTVVESPKPLAGWLRTMIVLLVIAAGAGLGYLAYLIVFAN